MATYVKGNAVENATSYELLEKSGSTYNSLATASEINFDVSALNLAAGDHVLVVKAKADGYTDSEYSNEVTYSVSEANVNLFTEILDASNGNDWYVMYSKEAYETDAENLVCGLVTSNSGKAKNVVIENLEAGATYSISFTNNTSGTYRARIVTFAEAFDDITIAALSADTNTGTTTTNVIYYDTANTTSTYDTTFTNTLNHKTLVMTIGWAASANGDVDLEVSVVKVA